MSVRGGVVLAVLAMGCTGVTRQRPTLPTVVMSRDSLERVVQLVMPESGPELDGLQIGSAAPPALKEPWRCHAFKSIWWRCESMEPPQAWLQAEYFQQVLVHASIAMPDAGGSIPTVCESYRALRALLTERVGPAAQHRAGPCEDRPEHSLFQPSCTAWKARGRNLSITVNVSPEWLEYAYLSVTLSRQYDGEGAPGECDPERT